MTRKEQINSFAIDKLLGLGPAFSENEIQYNNGYMRGLIEGAEWADEHSIEVKEVDLKEEIQSWVEDNSVNGYYQEDVYETAEHFFELGLKTKGE